MKSSSEKGFTLIELVIVIVILGILSAVAAPRFIDISRDAKVAKLNELAAQIKTTLQLIQSKAIVQGLRVNRGASRPQSEFIVDFEFGSVELNQRNLCPEARGELGTGLDFIDFMNISLDDGLTFRSTNLIALVGYDVPPTSEPRNQGCYVRYDSTTVCEVLVVTNDC